MSRRSTHHVSAARSAPFGTDIQPKLNVKIIGGVAVEIPVDSPPSSAGSKHSQKNLRAGPHGTPPLETQPLNTDYISKDSRESSAHAELQANHMTELHPTTSPSDSSNSHIHDHGGRRGSFPNPNRVLPPISSPKIPQDENDNSRHNQSPLLSPPRISPARPEITLYDQLRPHLKDYDSYRFKEMYADLAEFDRKLTGCVTHGQFNMVSLKHRLPVPTPLVKLLLSSFGHDSDPNLVNYEKLIQYLARVQLGTANAETLLQESVNKFVDVPEEANSKDALDYQIAKFEQGEDTAQLQYHMNDVEDRSLHTNDSSSNRTDRTKETKEIVKEKIIYVASKKPFRQFPDQENAKFMSLLKQQYTLDENDAHDFDAVREKFAEHDKSGTGIVTRKQIDQVCLFFRVPVQGSLLEKLLQRCETDSGKFSWVDFVNYLEQAQPKSRAQSKVKVEAKSTESSERPTTWPTSKSSDRSKQELSRGKYLAHQQEQPIWEQRKPLGRLETRVPKKGISEVEHEITRNDTPSEDRVSPTIPPTTPGSGNHSEVAQLRALAREHRQKREQQQRAAALSNQQSIHRPDDDPWFDRFMHLARGVYNSDSTNTGFLELEEMFRLIKNYNLIYQLGVSTSRIQNIVTSYSQGGRRVPIEPVLAALRLEKPK